MSVPPVLASATARWAAVLLVLVQCATLGWLARGHLFPVVMGLAAVLSLWEGLRIDLRQAPHWGWYALLGILLAVKYRIAPEVLDEQITFFNTVIGYEAARFLVFVQVVQLFIRWPGGRMPFWFFGVACLSMVFGSNVRLSAATQPLSLALCLTFVVALALFAAGNRRRAALSRDRLSFVLAAVALVVVLLAGAATAQVLRKFEGHLERWLAERGGADREDMVSPGFNGRGNLGDINTWKQHAAEHVALRVHARKSPGYLRGLAFDTLRDSNWSETARVNEALELEPERLKLPRRNEVLYVLMADAAESRAETQLNIWPDGRTGEHLFVPLEGLFLATQPTRLTINRNDIAERKGSGAPAPYTVWLDALPSRRPLDDLDRHRYLDLDERQRPALAPLAAEITHDCTTPREKMAAIARFFRDNFTYSLQRQWSPGTDPILAFLDERHPAHCEYFASAGALLLRSVDVPTRYVTGYVATEYNPEGGYWLARRRDAHAWIEAYDDHSQTWRSVECTPADGVPASAAQSGWSSWWDFRQQQLREWLHHLSVNGVRGLAATAGRALLTVPGLSILLLGSAAAVLWKRRQSRGRNPRMVSGPAYPALFRELQRTDRVARKCGFQRAPGETLTQFAGRLRTGREPPEGRLSELADWYDEYVRVRYSSAETAPVDLLTARRRRIQGRRR